MSAYWDDILIGCPLWQARTPNDVWEYCWVRDHHKAVSRNVQPACSPGKSSSQSFVLPQAPFQLLWHAVAWRMFSLAEPCRWRCKPGWKSCL